MLFRDREICGNYNFHQNGRRTLFSITTTRDECVSTSAYLNNFSALNNNFMINLVGVLYQQYESRVIPVALD